MGKSRRDPDPPTGFPDPTRRNRRSRATQPGYVQRRSSSLPPSFLTPVPLVGEWWRRRNVPGEKPRRFKRIIPGVENTLSGEDVDIDVERGSELLDEGGNRESLPCRETTRLGPPNRRKRPKGNGISMKHSWGEDQGGNSYGSQRDP